MILAGCRRPAYLRMNGHLSITQKRMNGYVEALKKYRIAFDPRMIVECTNDNTANIDLLKKMLKLKNRPDGVFASVEKLAISMYHACNEIGLKIPEQLKIISFSNLRTASLLSPSLSTITQPAFEIGREAAALLLQMIEKKNFSNRIEQIVLKSNLIERNSSRKRARNKE
jgi:LacI family transcriptional regulator